MLEEELRILIKQKYKNFSSFARACDMPRSTLATILSKGVKNANIHNIIAMCQNLGISADSLAEGRIEEAVVAVPVQEITRKERELLAEIRKLNSQGYKAVFEYVEMLANNEKYKREEK